MGHVGVRHYWYDLELTHTDDNLILQPAQGKFPVVGVWQNGLMVEQDRELRAVGLSQTTAEDETSSKVGVRAWFSCFFSSALNRLPLAGKLRSKLNRWRTLWPSSPGNAYQSF